MSRCRSCGAEIKFIKLTSGRFNPCDIAKRTMIKGEGYDVMITEKGKIIRGKFASVEEGANVEGYISHFATCPNAELFRKDKK